MRAHLRNGYWLRNCNTLSTNRYSSNRTLAKTAQNCPQKVHVMSSGPFVTNYGYFVLF